MVLSSTPFLLAAAIAAPNALVTPAQSLAIKPSPPPQPPKSLSSRSSSSSRGPATRPGWRGSDARHQQKHQSSTLRAYTVAENNNKPSWESFLRLPTFDFGPKDSLFSFEAGGAMNLATRPLMPNLEVEAATITAARDAKVENDDLLSELAALTESFEELQSSMDYKSQLHSVAIKTYESKVESLEVKNALLEEGLTRLTATLERQDGKLREIQQEKEEEKVAKGDVFDSMKALEADNEVLRQRVRVLELELSEVAYESRKVTPTPPIAVVENSNVVSVKGGIGVAKLSPKAPSVPVPAHIHQQRTLEQLQAQMNQYELERASVRKLFSLGIRRSVNKVGRALNLWSPVYNLLLWGELRGN